MTAADTTKASGAEPIYMYRPVMNAEQIHDWAREQGFASALEPDDMHVTVVFSKTAFSAEYSRVAAEHGVVAFNNVVIRGGRRSVAPLGDKGAVVLKVQSDELHYEHMEFRRLGASWDYQEYTPHITITYQGAPTSLEGMQPYAGDIVLGPLRAKPLNPDASSAVTEVLLQQPEGDIQAGMDQTVNKTSDILKVDTARRMVWGWASVSTVKGEIVTDLQGDRMSPEVMSKMADRFMRSARAAKAMHEGDDVGEVIHSFPLTKELADAFGIETDREGWITGTYIKSDEEWAKVLKGEYRGLSIGGKAKRRPA